LWMTDSPYALPGSARGYFFYLDSLRLYHSPQMIEAIAFDFPLVRAGGL